MLKRLSGTTFMRCLYHQLLKLFESFREKIPSTTCFQIGYIAKRGNGMRWIEDSPDLRSMYKQLDTITLFCEGRADDSTTSGGNKQ